MDRLTWNAVRNYIKEHKWDEVVILGDLLDFGFIGSFAKDQLRQISKDSWKKQYDLGNSFLDELQDLVKCKVVYISGNHEYRVERVIDKEPMWEGLIEVDKQLHLKERGIPWIDFWKLGKTYSIGKATFGHGLYTSTHHAKKHADAYGSNFFYGHTHDVSLFSKTTRGDNKTFVAQSLGCLCVYNLPYMRGKPSNWQQCITTMFFQDNGFFNCYPSMIFNHKFVSPDGQFYTA